MRIEKIGANIQELLDARGWSLRDLANAAGYGNVSNVQRVVKSGHCTIDKLAKIAEALGCTIGDLTDGAVDKTKFNPVFDREHYYPYNVAVASYRSTEILDCVYLPKLYEAIGSLSEREQKIIELRYKHYMTLEEVGREFQVTRERIREIEAKALRRLRSRRFVYDIDKLIAELEEANRERYALKLKNIVLEAKVTPDPGEKADAQHESRPEIPIIDLELSVRSYNCLARAGYRYVSDLEGVTYEKLITVRNLGRKSILEIVRKLKEYGIEVKHEDNA